MKDYPIGIDIEYDSDGKFIPYDKLRFTQDGDPYNIDKGLPNRNIDV